MFETKLSADWAKAIDQRRAVRQYDGPPDDAQLRELGALSRQLTWQNVRIMLLKGPGMRGNIKGTDVYAVLIAQKGAIPEQVGFAGEALALQCASMGLGCCWLGMYYKGVVRSAAKAKDDENVLAILAIGKCAPQTPAPKRKSLESLTGKTTEQLAALPEWQQEALRCARLAPSAVNLQPWRFEVGNNSVSIKKAGMSATKDGALDRGIAMMHISLGAFAKGVQGGWKTEAGSATFTKK